MGKFELQNKLKNVTADSSLTVIVMVKDYTEKKAKNGNAFTSLEVTDGEQTKNVNIFDTVAELEATGLVKNGIIKMNLILKNGYFNQSGWGLNDNPEITCNDFIKTAPVNVDEAFAEIVEIVKSSKSAKTTGEVDATLTDLTLALLLKNEEAFKTSSAAVAMHHNFLGGLVYHTQRMVKEAVRDCETYPALDKELLICGTALHDIGKIKCYDTDSEGNSTVNKYGALLEHSQVGISMIEEEARQMNINPERVLLLNHLLASHHGKLEWGALVTPKIPEAMMLHENDMKDSRMNMFEEAYKLQDAGTLSKEKVFGLDNSYIYRAN